MTDKCFRPEEIPSLAGGEAHLARCDACRALYDEYLDFRSLLSSSLAAASPCLYTLRRERTVQSLLAELETLPPGGRFNHVRQKDAFTPGLVAALSDRARSAFFRSPNEAERWLDLGKQILDSLKDRPGLFQPKDITWVEARHMADLGNLAMYRGCIQEAHALLSKARSLFQGIGDEFQDHLFCLSLSFTYTKMGHPLEARKICIEALPVLREYGARREYLGAMNNLALVMAALGRLERARTVLLRVKKAQAPEEPFAFLTLHNLVLVHLALKRPEAALEQLDELSDFSRRRGLRMEEGKALTLRGEIFLLQGRYEQALDLFKAAEALLREAGNYFEIALLHVYRAKALQALGCTSPSFQELQEALAFFVRERYGPDLIEALDIWEKAAQTPPLDSLASAAERGFSIARRFNRLFQPEASISTKLI